MPGFLMHVNAVMSCFHQAGRQPFHRRSRVLVNGQPVATISTSTGSPGDGGRLSVSGSGSQRHQTQPCVTIKWLMPSTRFLVNGLPAALIPAPGPGPAFAKALNRFHKGHRR